MINKKRFSGCPSETFCSTPELIENYDKAIADETQTWRNFRKQLIEERGQICQCCGKKTK